MFGFASAISRTTAAASVSRASLISTLSISRRILTIGNDGNPRAKTPDRTSIGAPPRSLHAVKPNPDAAAAARLGSALRRLDYTEDTLLERLGDEAYSSEPGHVLVHERRLGGTKLDIAIR